MRRYIRDSQARRTMTFDKSRVSTMVPCCLYSRALGTALLIIAGCGDGKHHHGVRCLTLANDEEATTDFKKEK